MSAHQLPGRDRHTHAPEPDLVRAWVVDDVVRLPRPVGEVDERLLPGLERVRNPRPGRTRDDASSPDLGCLFAERHRPRAFEHDEELLFIVLEGTGTVTL